MKRRADEPGPFTRFRDQPPEGDQRALTTLFRAVSEPEPLEPAELAAVRRRLVRDVHGRSYGHGRRRAREALMVLVALLSGAGVAFGGWGIVEWVRSTPAKHELAPSAPLPPRSNETRLGRPRTSSARVAPSASVPMVTPDAATPKSRLATTSPPAPRTSAAPESALAAASGLARESQSLTAALVALRRQRDPRAALAALDAYDSEFPNGALRREARVARVDAWVALGDCARALDAVDALVDGDAPPAVQERALYARASCRLRVGNDAGASSDLRRYLANYPSGRYAAEVTKLLNAGALR